MRGTIKNSFDLSTTGSRIWNAWIRAGSILRSFRTSKGWLREFEAELVWAHFGIGMDRVTHLRLQFYSSGIFPEYPDPERDVAPILNLLEKVRPTIISLALDPEGSGRIRISKH